MSEKRKRPVARRTLYLAIEEAMAKYGLDAGTVVGELLEAIKDDEWFRETK